MQHELVSNVSVDVGYFRRWYGNFLATDNRALAPVDFTGFSVDRADRCTSARWRRDTVSDLFNVTQAGFTRPPDNLLTFAERLRHADSRTGTVSTSASTRVCVTAWSPRAASAPAVVSPTTARCARAAGERRRSIRTAAYQEPFLTQFKMLAAYTVPRIGVQIAGTCRAFRVPVVQANVVYPAASLAPALGRPFVGGATAVVNVIAPSTEYGDRLNQLDFRVGKMLRLGRTCAPR